MRERSPRRGSRRRWRSILAICGPDDFIGEAFLQGTDTYRAEAVAMTEVTSCPIDRERFGLIAERAPGFLLTFAEVLASHLFHCRDQMSASYDPVKIRVVKILLEHTERFGRPSEDGVWHVLGTELEYEDIAALASATRVAVTMALSERREDGGVRGSRGHYQLHMPMLTALIDDVTGA